jgi:hypothetical protein
MSERLIYFIILFFLFGCSKDPQEVNIYSIPDEFKLDLHQAVSSQGSNPAFKISTLDTRTCTNDKLIVTISKIGNSLGIDILDIDVAPQCNNISGKVSTDVYAILSPGTYALNIDLKDQIINNGTITVTDQSYHLNLNTDYGLKIGKLNILKIPDGLIWGYIKEANTPSINGTDLYNRLLMHMTPKNDLPSGDYGLFKKEDEEVYFIDAGYSLNIDKKFLMQLNTSISEIKKIVKQFKEENPEVEFKIYTSRGVIN